MAIPEQAYARPAMPRDPVMRPSAPDVAKTILRDLGIGEHVPDELHDRLVQRIAEDLVRAMDFENGLCEALAQTAGDKAFQSGNDAQAQACWAVAARIRLRREQANG